MPIAKLIFLEEVRRRPLRADGSRPSTKGPLERALDAVDPQEPFAERVRTFHDVFRDEMHKKKTT